MTVKHKKRGVLPLILVLFLLCCAVLAFVLLLPKGDPGEALARELTSLYPARESALSGLDREIRDAAVSGFSLRTAGHVEHKLWRASGQVEATVFDTALLTQGLSDDMQDILEARAAAAARRSELYAEGDTLLPEVVNSVYGSALEARLRHAADYCREEAAPVSLRYSHGDWALENAAALRELYRDPPASPGFEEAAAALKPVELSYSLPPTGPGPVPDPSCYGESSDPRVIAALLETETAKRLIGGQKLDFDPDCDMLGRTIYYYLDETILVLVWQQDEHGAVGTFAEVFIADASQLRRKLADDTFGSYQYYYPSEFAAQTNAVLACSGDFYNSGRPDYGLYVYEGKLMRSCLYAGQSCLFTNEGDMLFVYEDQFSSVEQAQRYIDENHVVFSLSFGPVMIDNGVDVTPYTYPFGEVLDTYARCAVGQLGKRHYLMMTINCESPDHYVYVTLRQAADSMIAHGCRNAYTLDGGQTGSILIGGRLINPVQFGAERLMSDIFYFATALPRD